jgi:hypothetical protein
MALSYFINRKKTTCVVSFQGSLTLNDVECLELCLKEATAEPAKYFILNLAGLIDVEVGACRPFTLFQHGLRASSKLYLCDIPAEPGKILKGNGVVREGEVNADLMSCLQAIIKEETG